MASRFEALVIVVPMSLFQPIREFRSKLASGRFCCGIGITLSDPAVTEALGQLSDFYWIDLEHTPIGLETLQSHLIAARAVNMPALVRVPGSEAWLIKRVIDTGAPGIIVPQVRSAAEVKGVIDACRYRPEGDRGYGPRRASDYGTDAGFLKTANQDLFVSVQIENVDALRDLEAIAALPGLDSLVIGPFDLAMSMGYSGQVTHPEVVAAMGRIIATAKDRGLPVGMGGPADEGYVMRAVEAGVRWLQCGSDFEYMIQFAGQFLRGAVAKMPEKIRPHLSATASGY